MDSRFCQRSVSEEEIAEHDWPSRSSRERCRFDGGVGVGRVNRYVNLVLAGMLIIGFVTALIAYCIDVWESVLFDWKEGYCAGASPLLRGG